MADSVVCSAIDCYSPVKAKGLCQAHYMRLRRYGDPSINNRKIGRSVCDVEDCERYIVGNGKCSRHYVRPENPRRCEVENCDRPHKGRGFCKVHLLRLRKHGNVQADTPIVERGAADWLREHSDFSGEECLTWPFTRGRSGVGSVTATVVGRPRGNMSASRAMCILAHGEPPAPKMVAAHYCGNGHQACVNPRHLRWATVQENVDDTLRHGTRRTLGTLNRRSLTNMQIRAVKLLHLHMSESELAVVFGVSLEAIGRALGRASSRKHSPKT